MSDTAYKYRLTEEICRWAFEVALLSKPDWFIAFTNPTAGPWKRLMARDAHGVAGEVHRFEREETRPDLVLVNDELRVVVILEAKDDIAKLRSPDQVGKTAGMLARMSALLAAKASNPFWGKRASYRYCAGLLWGTGALAGAAGREEISASYRTALRAFGDLADGPMLLMECVRAADDSIECVPSETHRRPEDAAWSGALIGSLSA